ncbi:MAG: 50S ribosomal protein L4 [Candidatus Omnitrophica bacterium]|nr:50S ribosomal protein L4 [Candidatus Omnitrophota bacterium]
MEIPILNISAKAVDTLTLDSDVLGGRVNKAVLYEAVNMYRANQRAGTASTKTRGQVRGGGKKPWKQKHTGRARQGTIRAPQWRHGGIVFGPHPRDFSYDLSTRTKRQALLSSLRAKWQDQELVVLDDVRVQQPKTKEVSSVVKAFGLTKRSLLVTGRIDATLTRAARNLALLSVVRADEVNAYDVLSHHKILFTKEALSQVLTRCQSR